MEKGMIEKPLSEFERAIKDIIDSQNEACGIFFSEEGIRLLMPNSLIEPVDGERPAFLIAAVAIFNRMCQLDPDGNNWLQECVDILHDEELDPSLVIPDEVKH